MEDPEDLPEARFWGHRSASNPADLPAKPPVHPFSVQALN